MILTHNMKQEIIKSKRNNTPLFIYSVVRKIGSDEVMEVQKIDTKTQKKEIVFQHKDYKKLIDKIKEK